MTLDPEYRKKIDELVAMYELDPDLRDVYVEGPSEGQLLLWFLRQCGCAPVNAYMIDCVDIQKSLIRRLGLGSTGNRDQVVALSLEFERLLKKEIRHLTCVADPDFDLILGTARQSPYLTYTDYPGVEVYGCCEPVISKCLEVAIPGMSGKVERLLDNFTDVLQELFLIRAANVRLGWEMTWIDFTSCCKLQAQLVVFDRAEFAKKYLLSNRHWGDRDRFNEVVEQLRAVRVASVRQRIRGHDFIELLGWYISRRVKKDANKYRDSAIVRPIVIAAIDAGLLSTEEKCNELLARYR